MCSSAAVVLLCVCVCRMRVRVRTPAILPHLPPAFLRYKSLPSPPVDAGVSSGVHTALAVCVCSTHTCLDYDMCSAAVVLLCVCVCRIRARVRICHTTSPSSSVPAVQIPSITCICIISYVCSLDYAFPATAVCPVKSVRVFQHVTSYTRLPAYNVTHAHFVITPCGLPSQILLFPLQGTKYQLLSTSILSVTFSASKRKSPTKHSATPDDRQVPSRAVQCEKTFSHSRRSPSVFSRSQML